MTKPTRPTRGVPHLTTSAGKRSQSRRHPRSCRSQRGQLP